MITGNRVADAEDRLGPRRWSRRCGTWGARWGGVPVLGQYHWSLLDNFEWADGYGGRFGLYRVDFTDPERPRTRTRSAELYSGIARSGALAAS